MKHLTSEGIQVRPFWVPMHKLRMFKDEIYVSIKDVAGEVYSNCVSLPCSTNLTDADQEKVTTGIKNFYGL